VAKKRNKRRNTANTTTGNNTTGNSAATTDPTQAHFQKGLAVVDKGVSYALLPVALAGSAVAVSVRELLSSKFYPFFGGCIAILGLCLSAEAYWVGLGSGAPFIPKMGINDGATIQSLLGVINGEWPLRLSFLVLVLMAIGLQVIESVPWRKGMGSRRRRGQKIGMIVWVLVGLGYILDVHSVMTTYRDDGLAIPTVVWGLLSLIGAEFGLGLSEAGKE